LDLLGRSTPLVGNNGSNGSEKFAMDRSLDEEAQRHSGGVFAPFGGQFFPLFETKEIINNLQDTTRPQVWRREKAAIAH
jgi:hypothetical protein